MIIRELEETDLQAASSLIQLNLKHIVSMDYAPEHLANYQKGYSVERLEERLQNSLLIVAQNKDRLMGVAGINNEGMVFGVYVHPDFIGEGVGKGLVEYLEIVAHQQGRQEIFLYSTTTSHPFWEKRGYETLEEKFHPTWGNYVSMKKTIS